VYNKTANWYISKEMQKVSKKIEAKINQIGTPTVKLRVKIVKDTVNIEIEAPFYAKIQDKGVKGIHSGKSIAGYKFKKDMPPPDKFSRYTSDPKEQFLIARSVWRKGIPAKKYIDTVFGHYAPQIVKAIDKGTITYIDKTIEQAYGTSI